MKKSNARKAVVLTLLMFISFPCVSGEVHWAKVKHVRIDWNGVGVIRFDSQIINPASCVQESFKDGVSFDMNTIAGKVFYSTALIAQQTGQRVSVTTAGHCNHFGGHYVEALYRLWIHDS